jgi:RNA polymerase sigma factor (sigma-70 family)
VPRIKHNADAFGQFVKTSEPRLRQALSASLGSELGREAAVDVLSYAWENWERVQTMVNPVGYLYVVGRDRARHSKYRKRSAFLPADPTRLPWIEPSLPSALENLPDRQREVVVLLHCYQWTMSEVAELLKVAKTTVQNHADRGLASLRQSMGVEV